MKKTMDALTFMAVDGIARRQLVLAGATVRRVESDRTKGGTPTGTEGIRTIIEGDTPTPTSLIVGAVADYMEVSSAYFDADAQLDYRDLVEKLRELQKQFRDKWPTSVHV